MSFLEPGDRNMRVDLGRGEARVAQEFLNRPQVRSVVKEMGGEGVAHHVRGDPPAERDLQRTSMQPAPKPS